VRDTLITNSSDHTSHVLALSTSSIPTTVIEFWSSRDDVRSECENDRKCRGFLHDRDMSELTASPQMFQMEDVSDLETMVQSYAVNSLLLYVLYFVSQVSAIDPKARLAEDSEMVAAKVEELNKIENGDDEAAKDMVRLHVKSSIEGVVSHV